MFYILRTALIAVFLSSFLIFSNKSNAQANRYERMYFDLENTSIASAYYGAPSSAFISELEKSMKHAPTSSDYDQNQSLKNLIALIKKHNVLVAEGNINEIYRSMGVYRLSSAKEQLDLKNVIRSRIQSSIRENLLDSKNSNLKFANSHAASSRLHRQGFEIELKMILYSKQNKGLTLEKLYLKVLTLSKKYNVVMDDSFFRNYLPTVSDNRIEAASIEYLAIKNEFVPKVENAGACENCTFNKSKLKNTPPKDLSLKTHGCRSNCGTNPFYINGHLVPLSEKQKQSVLFWLSKDANVAAKKLRAIHGGLCSRKMRQSWAGSQ